MLYRLPVLGEQKLLMRKSPTAVFARRREREQVILRLPFRAGESWRIDFSDQDLADCTVMGEEEIEVLGRKVRCTRLRVLRTSRLTGGTTEDFEWYAPGIGLARMRVTLLGLTQTFVLESFRK